MTRKDRAAVLAFARQQWDVSCRYSLGWDWSQCMKVAHRVHTHRRNEPRAVLAEAGKQIKALLRERDHRWSTET